MIMKAAVLHGNEDLRYEDISEPAIRPNSIKVHVKAVGICGSDIPRVNNNGAHFYPIVLGHEFSGEIVEIGEGVENFQIGDRVAAAPLIPCMKCEDCLKGDYSLCKNYSFIGSREQGAFAEYIVIPAVNAVKFHNTISFVQGAMFEPSTVALHGLLQNRYKGGENVAVLGGGTIGLFVMQWAKIFGSKNTTVFDIDEHRLELAKKLGADEVINSRDEDYIGKAKTVTGNRGYDYVFETAGVTATMQDAFNLAANKANVCFVGTPTKELAFDPKLWENINRKEFTLTGSWMSYSAPFPGREWTLTAHYYSTGQLKFDSSLIYKDVPLSSAAEMFELYKIPGKVKGKILLKP